MQVYIPDSVPDKCVPYFLTKGKRYVTFPDADGDFEIVDDEGDNAEIEFRRCTLIDGHDWRLVCMGVI